MNATQRKEISKIISELETLREQMDGIKSRIEELQCEEQDKFDNLTEALQQNERVKRLRLLPIIFNPPLTT